MNKYLSDIRKLSGHLPVLVCGASVIVENQFGEILLHLRNDNKCWAYPGGAVDINEIVESAAKRELKEETGLIANTLNLFGVYSGEDMYHIYPNGDEISNVDIVFICSDYCGDIVPDYIESNDVKFFKLAELPDNISPPCKRALADYKLFRGL